MARRINKNSRQMAYGHNNANDDNIESEEPKIQKYFTILETAVKTGVAGIMTHQIVYPWMISLSYAFPVVVFAFDCCCFCRESTLTTATWTATATTTTVERAATTQASANHRKPDTGARTKYLLCEFICPSKPICKHSHVQNNICR